MNSPEATRTVLALNIGSASVKAASYALGAAADGGQSIIRETGRILVESTRTSLSTPADDAEKLLARVAQHFSNMGDAPDTVAHRIVHGGDRAGPVELTPPILADLAGFSAWAPLHQVPALALVGAAIQRYPGARQIGVFDTSWHQTMPEKHRALAVPYALCARGVKRYGFHGLAFQSVMRQLNGIAPGLAHGRVVLAHLGGGSSLCAVRNGRSISTTMGMTPLGGIPMATRSGSLDPGVLLHLQRSLAMSPDEIDRLLWQESGLKGISGESGDMRQLLASTADGARLAIDVYVSGIVQGVAAMAACIGGLDALVFSGGIGAHAAEIRARVTDELTWLGLVIDAESNQAGAQNLTAAASLVSTYALAVDEEKEMVVSIAALDADDTAQTQL